MSDLEPITYTLKESVYQEFPEAFMREMLETSGNLPQELQDVHARIKALKKDPKATSRQHRALHHDALVLAKKHGLKHLTHFHVKAHNTLLHDEQNRKKTGKTAPTPVKARLYAKGAHGTSHPVKLNPSALMHAHEGAQLIRPTQPLSASSIGAWTRVEDHEFRNGMLRSFVPAPPGVVDAALAVDKVKQVAKAKIGSALKKTGITKVIPPGLKYVASVV